MCQIVIKKWLPLAAYSPIRAVLIDTTYSRARSNVVWCSVFVLETYGTRHEQKCTDKLIIIKYMQEC